MKPLSHRGRFLCLLTLALGLALFALPATAQGSVAGCGEWELVPSPNPSDAARLTDIHAIAPWDVWAVGWFDGPIDGYWDNRWQC